MRELIAFPCVGDTLVGTLDAAEGGTGLLIVSGGNEIRIGAHRGMALLAADIAAVGHPVFRFDRRGIGDSTGANRGFEASGDDIAAAVAAFRRAAPGVTRVVAFGNCDAASALALHGVGGIDAFVLANPWVIETADALPPAAAIRARYAERLRDPKAWLRLVTGGVNMGKLAQGLSKVSKAPAEEPAGLAGRLAAGMAARAEPIMILLAKRDNTAVAFNEAWQASAFDPLRGRLTIAERDTGSHSFHTAEDKAWLREQLLRAMAP
ncbi:hydrolase 1, exosortase A system-associated [Sphingomonas qomolangmaensis]|uniref:Hydrolase 1, exosortase A system-associated n=1 Tax=Sphingomonas qomolangmaensis TaxID=2918765 RepID=A0ABY5L9W8_9SPHN|nr:hydrolase 1, exosortase A system-associated [Sphingomonas qomolangmaensis]UUL83227.1 hydrolase 1, exosortase A system-associated [Sphingomonas qomolangmaensis]